MSVINSLQAIVSGLPASGTFSLPRQVKTLLIIFAVTVSTAALSQTAQSYTAFNSTPLSLYAWPGNKMVLLSSTNTLNPVTMNNWVLKMDTAYDYYAMCTGKQPTFYTGMTYINNRATIADVPSTCGAGCGYLGWTGIEMQNIYFMNMYNYIHTQNLYDQVPFYELGRNFWFYDGKLKYLANDPIVTGYAVFMRFMAMEAAHVQGAPFNSWTFTQFKNNVINLLNTYTSTPSLNWSNTLGSGAGVPGSGLGATDLFASFCFYLRDHSCNKNWVENVWKFAEQRPDAVTTQDAVDNFIIASSQAANANLVSLFQSWKWPVSVNAITHINSLNLGINLSVTASSPSLCTGSTATLQATGANTYTWQNAASQPSIIITPSATSVYSVSGSSGVCTASAAITISVVSPPQVSIAVQPSDSVCAGATVTLTAMGGYSNYFWQGFSSNTATLTVNPGATSVYQVTGADNGCTSTESATLNIRNNPVATVSIQSAFCDQPCAGTVNVAASAGMPPYSFAIAGTSCTTFPCAELCPGLYKLSTTDAAGCSSFNFFSVSCVEVSTTGLGEMQTTLKVYPNPAGERIKIIFPGNFDCTLYSISGLSVSDTIKGYNALEIATGSIGNGIYLLDLRGADGIVYRRKVVVKH